MRYFSFALIALSLSACATNEYKPINTAGTVCGYEEAPLGQGKYRVAFQGCQIPPSAIYQNFLRRSAELAKKDGYQFFKVENGQAAYMHKQLGLYQAQLPNYSGTVIFLKSKDADSFNVAEIESLAPKSTPPPQSTPQPQSNPFKSNSGV